MMLIEIAHKRKKELNQLNQSCKLLAFKILIFSLVLIRN